MHEGKSAQCARLKCKYHKADAGAKCEAIWQTSRSLMSDQLKSKCKCLSFRGNPEANASTTLPTPRQPESRKSRIKRPRGKAARVAKPPVWNHAPLASRWKRLRPSGNDRGNALAMPAMSIPPIERDVQKVQAHWQGQLADTPVRDGYADGQPSAELEEKLAHTDGQLADPALNVAEVPHAQVQAHCLEPGLQIHIEQVFHPRPLS
mmetsp:Transcript_5736/g.21794  ORF Transcript_5736/g.21794 Transcript_5736/m.21794 type:complete len:206 (-) Transcript_5736:586-1203(-)